MSGRMQLSGERGFSVVEAIVGIVMLSIGLIGLAKSSALGFSQVTRARQDMQYAAEVQQVMDSLRSRGYGLVASGSVAIRGRAVSWTVTSPTANSQLVQPGEWPGVSRAVTVTSPTVTLSLSRTVRSTFTGGKLSAVSSRAPG